MLWMEGDLVAVGSNGCDMNFVGTDLHTPACSSDMWVAIQAVDSEATSVGGHSKGGIKAAMKWCGQEIATDATWECSTVAERDWQNPVANGFDPRMEFDAARPLFGESLACRHRQLPSCSWVRRNTAAVADPATQCPPGSPNTSPLCKQEWLLADCESRTSAAQCSGQQWALSQGLFEQGKADREYRGVCRWEPTNPDSIPCGDGPAEGKCVLDLTCTEFSAADVVKFDEQDKQGDKDDISNVLDSKSAKWIWVDKDTKEWSIENAETGPGSCSWCGRQTQSNDPCLENECRAVDPVCKWDPERTRGGYSDCRVERPQVDEDTVYCRKHVQCTGDQLDPKTNEPIVCEEAAADQRRNLTLGCGQCQMCKNLAYQSPGDKATTQTCVQAYNEPCDAFYTHSACIDPILKEHERTEKGLPKCPMDASSGDCAAVQGCQYVDAILEEGTSCPAKWGGMIPVMTIDKNSVWVTLTSARQRSPVVVVTALVSVVVVFPVLSETEMLVMLLR